MSGKTFAFSASWDEAFRAMFPDMGMSERNRAVATADSMNRELEEFISRFVVTATNDAGDITFDAAGTYTFLGDVSIEGDLTITDDLQSANWVADTTGWILRQDGTFEFNTDGELNGNLDVNGTITSTGDSVTMTIGPDALFSGYVGFGLSTVADGQIGGAAGDNGWDGIIFGGVDGRGIIHNNSGRSTHSAGTDLYLEAYGGDVYISGSGSVNLEMNNGQIVGSGSAAASSPDFTRLGDTNTGIFWPGSDIIGFSAGGTERVRIDTGRLELQSEIISFDGIGSDTYFQMSDNSTFALWVVNGSSWMELDNSGFSGSTYGSLHIEDGSGDGGYEGVNLHGEYVFMTNGSIAGIYDDLNNSWEYLSIGPSTTTLDNLRTHRIVESDASDGDLDYHYSAFSANSDTGGSSTGTGYNLLNDEIGGFSGTTAVMATTTLSSITGKRLGFSASKDEGKMDALPWDFTDEAFLKLQPSSFLVRNMYVDDYGRHHYWDPERAVAAEGADPPPDNWVPLRRFGLMWTDLLSDPDLYPIATDQGWDAQALAAGTVPVVQRLLGRVSDLEASNRRIRRQLRGMLTS